MTCTASDNRAGTEELRSRMTHDNYSTAADKVFRDGTLFPQPRNHICGAKAISILDPSLAHMAWGHPVATVIIDEADQQGF